MIFYSCWILLYWRFCNNLYESTLSPWTRREWMSYLILKFKPIEGLCLLGILARFIFCAHVFESLGNYVVNLILDLYYLCHSNGWRDWSQNLDWRRLKAKQEEQVDWICRNVKTSMCKQIIVQGVAILWGMNKWYVSLCGIELVYP